MINKNNLMAWIGVYGFMAFQVDTKGYNQSDIEKIKKEWENKGYKCWLATDSEVTAYFNSRSYGKEQVNEEETE